MQNTNPPIEKRPEFDRYGTYTGYDYYKCIGCGYEAMWRSVVEDRCECRR